ncbi:MotA/TolQ/ExbB proton channel family protein [Pseudomonas lactucae]|uniref:MotA/TolQ/ExbB proton channel family protein n=1 Tax=Pseudomonas lactucae TaxID=2813360 RepID=UPI002FCCF29D
MNKSKKSKEAFVNFFSSYAILQPALCFSAEDANKLVTKVLPITPSGEISPWLLYTQADSVGRGVMLTLAFFSITCWAIFIVKSICIWISRNKLVSDLSIVSDSRSLDDIAISKLGLTSQNILSGVFYEMHNISPGSTDEKIKDRVSSRLFFFESQNVRNLSKGIGILATVSAVAPFVGLFGTVWGIMHSFLSLAQSNVTNLNLIAPSIAESLYATALGLAVAIPALIFYNLTSRLLNDYQILLHEVSTAISDFAENSDKL